MFKSMIYLKQKRMKFTTAAPLFNMFTKLTNKKLKLQVCVFYQSLIEFNYAKQNFEFIFRPFVRVL